MSIRSLPPLLLASLLVAASARAEGASLVLVDGPPPPEQVLRTDPPRPLPRLAVVADPLGAIRGEYGLGIRKALGRAHAVSVSPSFVAIGGARGLALEVGYVLLPLRRGVVGPYVEAIAGGLFVRADGEERWAIRGGGELGYLHSLSGVVVGGGLGAVADRFVGGGSELVWSLRARVFLGYAFF